MYVLIIVNWVVIFNGKNTEIILNHLITSGIKYRVRGGGRDTRISCPALPSYRRKPKNKY